MVGANLPDLDVLAYFDGPAADLEWRRGWSHGVLALAVLPFMLTGLLLLLHRWRRLSARWSSSSTPDPRQLLLLSVIAILSHPILDTLNTYGVRWLMPFSGKWFYGDTLFIVDPWVWLVLALGIYFSRRRERCRRSDPARPVWLSLGAITLYVGAMALSGSVAARLVARPGGDLSLAGAAPRGPGPAGHLFARAAVSPGGLTGRRESGGAAVPRLGPVPDVRGSAGESRSIFCPYRGPAVRPPAG